MNATPSQHLTLLITIVDRGKGQHAVDLLKKDNVLLHYILLGHGTAKSEILELLGIGEPAKDIVFTLLSTSRAKHSLHRLRNTLQFDNPGHGIAFLVPIGSIASAHAASLLQALTETGGHHAEKERSMEHTERHHDLIIAIVDRGFSDTVMDAARPAGAKGGTVVHARGAGVKEAEKFFGITIQPEREMVFILVNHALKRPIMDAVCKEAGLLTDGHGLVFCLPVDDVAGVARIMREVEED